MASSSVNENEEEKNGISIRPLGRKRSGESQRPLGIEMRKMVNSVILSYLRNNQENQSAGEENRNNRNKGKSKWRKKKKRRRAPTAAKKK